MAWTKDMFGVEKPIIALLHLRALPGDPLYAGDVEQVFRQAREDLIALQDGGVDGVLIANEFSLPYQPQAEPVTVGAMGYLVGRLKENIRVPFGVNVVLNPMASLELAASTGAHFIYISFAVHLRELIWEKMVSSQRMWQRPSGVKRRWAWII